MVNGRLAQNDIERRLRQMMGWKLIEGRISKEFRFANFPTAILFINKLVDPAEELGHHPELKINYNRVAVSLITHEAGGLTEKDFFLAKRIDELS